jgi:hypothetical protein
MNETNKKIDEYLKKQLFKKIAFGVCVTLTLTVFFLIAYMPPIGEQSEITGIVVTMTAVQHDEGHTLRMLVRLDSGKEVFVFIPQSRFYKKGKKVKLLKREPLFWGRAIYSFRGYEHA